MDCHCPCWPCTYTRHSSSRSVIHHPPIAITSVSFWYLHFGFSCNLFIYRLITFNLGTLPLWQRWLWRRQLTLQLIPNLALYRVILYKYNNNNKMIFLLLWPSLAFHGYGANEKNVLPACRSCIFSTTPCQSNKSAVIFNWISHSTTRFLSFLPPSHPLVSTFFSPLHICTIFRFICCINFSLVSPPTLPLWQRWLWRRQLTLQLIPKLSIISCDIV